MAPLKINNNFFIIPTDLKKRMVLSDFNLRWRKEILNIWVKIWYQLYINQGSKISKLHRQFFQFQKVKCKQEHSLVTFIYVKWCQWVSNQSLGFKISFKLFSPIDELNQRGVLLMQYNMYLFFDCLCISPGGVKVFCALHMLYSKNS